jgi:hypothetical protein
MGKRRGRKKIGRMGEWETKKMEVRDQIGDLGSLDRLTDY